MKEVRKKALIIQVLIIALAIAQILAVLPSVVVNQVFSSSLLMTTNDYSKPQTHSTSGITVTYPANAYDKNNASFAFLNYGTAPAGYFQLATFRAQDVRSQPYPVIKQVDLKMRYGAQVDTSGETYKIDYLVTPSTSLQPLVAPTGSAHTNTTEMWTARTEPNDGVWTWTDIQNIKLRVTTSGATGPSMSARFYEFEGWATIVIESSPKLFVNPANITDTLKDVESIVSVDVKLENVSDAYGVEFKLRYDPNLMQADPNWTIGNLFPTTPVIFQNVTDNIRGLIWIAYTRNAFMGAEPSVFGSGTLASINFVVKGKGLTTLNLFDTIIGNSVPNAIPHDVVDGYFRNVAMPYGASVEIKVPPPEPKESPFTIDINVTKPLGQSGAFGICSWEFNVTYDATLLTATSVYEGEFLRSTGAGTSFSRAINDANGWVWVYANLWQDQAGGAWGNGTLARIRFKIKGSGTSYLNFALGKTKLTRLDYGSMEKFDFPVNTINDEVEVGHKTHDIAITSVVPETTLAYQGYPRDINVTVTNNGDWNENFGVTVYYNSTIANVEGYGIPLGDLAVDGYVSDPAWETNPWTKTGASPYLDAVDYPTSYVSASANGARIGDFTFEDMTSNGMTLLSVKLKLKAWNTGDDSMSIYFYDYVLDVWSGAYTVAPSLSSPPGYYSIIDISGVINTWGRLNATKMRIEKLTTGAEDTIGIDHAYLTVNEDAQTETGWTKVGATPYLNATDHPTNYINSAISNAKTGDFSFTNVYPAGKALAGVKLFVRIWNTLDDGMYISLYDVVNNAWPLYVVYPTSNVAPGSYVVVDVYGTINTWEKLNGTRMRIQKFTRGTEDNVGIDHAYLAAYFTDESLGTQQVNNLLPGQSVTLTFTWDTTNVPYGYYEVKARASIVLGETNIADNIRSGGVVTLTTPGDVNADKTVDVFDILKLKFHRSGPPPGPGGYNIDVDINNDTFIDVFDILIAKAHLGESW